jgi:uncharacterized membrane protein YgcG
MAKPPSEFGKRKPVVAPPVASPPVKRSRHVALLLTGTLAVGGSAYALMPRENCQPASSAMAGPAPPISGMTTQPAPTALTTCGSRSSGGGHGGSSSGWSSRSSFYGGGSSSSGTSTGAGSTTTARGGFGSFAHLFSGGG